MEQGVLPQVSLSGFDPLIWQGFALLLSLTKDFSTRRKKMKKLVLVGVCLLLFMGVTAVAQDEPVTMDLDAALSYCQSDSFVIEYSDAGKTQLLGIIDAFKGALGITTDLDETNEDKVGAFAVDPSLKDVVNKLSQAYYTLANVFVDPSENEDIYLKGKNWGLKSLRMNPGFAELEKSRFDSAVAAETDAAALYWTNSNWLRVAQKNPLQAVMAGVTKRTVAIMDRLIPVELTDPTVRTTPAFLPCLDEILEKRYVTCAL
jgi:hypothetical protein